MMDDEFFYFLPQKNGYETVNPAISTSAIGICLSTLLLELGTAILGTVTVKHVRERFMSKEQK